MYGEILIQRATSSTTTLRCATEAHASVPTVCTAHLVCDQICELCVCVAADFVYYDVTESNSETFQMSPHHAKHAHSWYYFPQMTADEALVFMQYDSDTTSRCRYTTHSSLTVNNEFTDYPRESIEVRLVAFFPQERDTMPDMTLPPHLMVDGAIAAIKEMIAHLDHWDSNGKNWVKGLASKGKLSDIVVGLCHHKRREGKLGEFKDLTDDDIKLVVKGCLATDELAKNIKNHLRIKIP